SRLATLTSRRISYYAWDREDSSQFQQSCLQLSAYWCGFFQTISPNETVLWAHENNQSGVPPGPVSHTSLARLIYSAWPPASCFTPPPQRGHIFSRPLSPAKR